MPDISIPIWLFAGFVFDAFVVVLVAADIVWGWIGEFRDSRSEEEEPSEAEAYFKYNIEIALWCPDCDSRMLRQGAFRCVCPKCSKTVLVEKE